MAFKCSVLNKWCQGGGKDIFFTPLTDSGPGIFKLCFLSAYTAWVQSYPELFPSCALTSQHKSSGNQGAPGISTGSLEVSPPILLTISFCTAVIEIVSANQENSLPNGCHPFPVWGQKVTLSFCSRQTPLPVFPRAQ